MATTHLKSETLPAGELTYTLASQQEIPIMLDLLRATADWMVQNNLKQWYPEQFTPDLMKSYLEEREVIIARLNEEPIGMFTLQWSDPSYWGERNSEEYGYLHRLVVDRAYRGHQVGQRMLRFAEERVLAAGKKALRLDCVAHNPQLNRYYQSLGFQFVAEQDMQGRVVNLYEKMHHD